MRLLAYMEQTLIDEGVLKSDFAVFAMQPNRRPVKLVARPFRLMDKVMTIWQQRVR